MPGRVPVDGRTQVLSLIFGVISCDECGVSENGGSGGDAEDDGRIG